MCSTSLKIILFYKSRQQEDERCRCYFVDKSKICTALMNLDQWPSVHECVDDDRTSRNININSHILVTSL